MDDRGMLSVRQRRDGARPLRGAFLAWLASAHDAIDDRLGLPGGIARPLEANADRRGLRQSEQKESIAGRMIHTATLMAISVQELRRLITHLQPLARQTWAFAGRGQFGDADTRP